jgi:hypothetical protein
LNVFCKDSQSGFVGLYNFGRRKKICKRLHIFYFTKPSIYLPSLSTNSALLVLYNVNKNEKESKNEIGKFKRGL